MEKPSKPPVAMVISIVTMCFILVITWLVMGVLSGIKPPFTFLVWHFEGGYSPEPGFMSTLTTIVTSVLSAAMGAIGANRFNAAKQTATETQPVEKVAP